MNKVDCEKLSQTIKQKCKTVIDSNIAKGKREPCLAVISMGSDPVVTFTLKSIEQSCQQTGITFKNMEFNQSETTSNTLASAVMNLDRDDTVDGILILKPLAGMTEKEIGFLEALVIPQKDVNGVRQETLVRLDKNWETKAFIPYKTLAAMKIITTAFGRKDLNGLFAGVIGSNETGRTVTRLLCNSNAITTMCNNRASVSTLETVCRNSNMIVTCVNKPSLITEDMIDKDKHTIIIDCGMSGSEMSLSGDCDISVRKNAEYLNTVEGFNSLSMAMLMNNTAKAYTEHVGK